MSEAEDDRTDDDAGPPADPPTRSRKIDPADPADPDALAMARARARVYGLLAATFDGDMDALATALERDVLVHLADLFPTAIDAADIEEFDHDADTLAVGYDNLFVVPGSHYVPPFASGHATDPSEEFESDSRYHTAGEAGELLGDPAANMARLYDAAGFEPERGDGIPDHLAACFEFMRALCEREAAVLEAGSPDESALETVYELQGLTLSHLGWLDQFEAAVDREDNVEGVFAALARIARSFTAWDASEDVPDRSANLTDGIG